MAGYPPVKPGDLITAELINQILADLDTLKSNMCGVAGGPPIIETVSAAEIGMGQTLRLTGKNFGDPSNVTITVGGGLVTQIDTNVSNDQLLAFVTPTILGILNQGQSVPIVVSNNKGTATASVVIKPGQAPSLIGKLTVKPASPPPQTITARNSFVWTFPTQIVSTLSARYSLVASISRSDWTVKLLGLNNVVDLGSISTAEMVIDQSPPESPTNQDFQVQVDIPSGVPDNTEASLTFTIQATEKPSLSSSSMANVKVGTVSPQPSTDVVITLSSPVIPPGVKEGAVLKVPSGVGVVAKFDITVTEAGQHILKPLSVLNDPGNLWTPTVATSLGSNGEFLIPAANQAFTLDTIVTAQARAPKAKLRLEVTNAAGTKSGDLEQNIKLL